MVEGGREKLSFAKTNEGEVEVSERATLGSLFIVQPWQGSSRFCVNPLHLSVCEADRLRLRAGAQSPDSSVICFRHRVTAVNTLALVLCATWPGR